MLIALVGLALISAPKTAEAHPMITNERQKFLMTVSYLGRNQLSRGIRNNNPGNIKISSSAWQGKLPVSQNNDGVFEQFRYYYFGVRAMIIVLRNYMNKHNLTTLRGIIGRYAPPNENHTSTYADTISKWTGIGLDQPLKPDQATLRTLVKTMARYETGVADAVDDEMFTLAYIVS